MTTQLSLMDLIEQRIAAGKVDLPPANRITAKLQSVTTDPDFAMGDVVELISSDQALTTEVLRVANGAFYGGLSQVRSVRDAVVRLGAPEIVRLAVMSGEKAAYRARTPQLQAMIPPLWQHAVATAMGARWLAKKLGFNNLENEAFIGGLLHDVGSLMLVRIIDDLMIAGELEATLPPAVLVEIIETGHTRRGYELARHWHLPDVYCDVVRDHHERGPVRGRHPDQPGGPGRQGLRAAGHRPGQGRLHPPGRHRRGGHARGQGPGPGPAEHHAGGHAAPGLDTESRTIRSAGPGRGRPPLFRPRRNPEPANPVLDGNRGAGPGVFGELARHSPDTTLQGKGPRHECVYGCQRRVLIFLVIGALVAPPPPWPTIPATWASCSRT